jgi:DNA-binding MarR family transcriptional regulator
MELDFRSIKALSSRSRIHILQELLREGATPSQLSDKVGSNTSNIVMHLETLSNAGLVQEQEMDQGFGTMYVPTDKARTIVDNGESQVKFSVGSSMMAGLAGLALGAHRFLIRGSTYMRSTTQGTESPVDRAGRGTSMGDDVKELSNGSGVNASPEDVPVEEGTSLIDGVFQDPLLGVSLLLLVVASVLLVYGAFRYMILQER